MQTQQERNGLSIEPTIELQTPATFEFLAPIAPVMPPNEAATSSSANEVGQSPASTIITPLGKIEHDEALTNEEHPKTLDEYAKDILEAHQRVDRAEALSKRHGKDAISAAVKAGKYLIDAKILLGHGNWLGWLKANCKGISEKTAQRYMTLAKSDTVSVLNQCNNLRQAYIFTGAIKAAHVDKNPDDVAVADETKPVIGDTPETILEKLGRKFVGCRSLYKTLVKASPDLEGNLFDCCDLQTTPLPILLEQWRHALNDALCYFGLPTVQVACVRCGRVREPNEFFSSIFSHVKEYTNRHEWCDDCVAHYKTVEPGIDVVEEIKGFVGNVTELKSISVEDYTFAQKYYQLAETVIAEPWDIGTAERRIWTPNNLDDGQDTIALIERLAPKIVIVKDKATHQLWNVYRHIISSAVNNPTPGRYIKFIVVDESQQWNPVLGIGAISGDFTAMAQRDDFIGWTKEQKEDGKLKHTAVASTIVPTQPFGVNFNGAKLIAALTTSQPIRDEWQSLYGDVLVGMTTTSLFGVPSMYDQIDEWKRLGETTGKTLIQPKLSIYRKWLKVLKDTQAHEFKEMMKQDADVSGPVTNYKGKVLTMMYKAAGIKPTDFQHGFRRGIYFSEFYENTRDFLCGLVTEGELKIKPLFQETVQEITDRWREQAIKRYQTLKANGGLKPEKLSYSKLGQMDFETAKTTFRDDVGR
jgi:Domain of unknown function (DUF4338)/Protein of unknown function (DUF3102)